MASLGTAGLLALFLSVALVAALCGFCAATSARTKQRRTRRVFLVGVACGLLAGEFYRVRRHGRLAPLAAALRGDLRIPLAAIGRGAGRLGWSFPQARPRRRRVGARSQ